MKNSLLNKPTQCRFDGVTKKRIEAVSRRFGIKPSSLIRHAVQHQLAEFERSGRIVIEQRKPQNGYDESDEASKA